MLKKAVEFLKENGNKKVLIIFDTDGDGIGAASILAKTLKKVFRKMPEAMPANHSLSFIDERMFQKSKKFDVIITVDAAVDEKPDYVLRLAKKANILIIDHHQINKNLNSVKNILHINPNLWKTRFTSYKYCTSKIVYDICSKLTNIEDLNWLAGIGIVNDRSEDVWKGFLERVYKKYKISLSKLRMVNDIITSGYYYSGSKGVVIGYKACLEASSPVDILKTKTANSKKLKRFYDAIEREIVLTAKNWRKNAEIIEDKKLIILKLDARFSISSPISTKISFEKPNYTVLVTRKNGKMTYMSLRRQDKKVNCGRIAQRAIKNLNNASGGGHCIHPDTLITMNDGRLVKLKDLDANCKLKSVNFNNLNISNSKCTRKFDNQVRSTLYNIKTTYGFSLISSPEHRVFTLKSVNGKIGIAEKKIKDLKIGDFIASVNSFDPKCVAQSAPDVSDVIKKANKVGHRWKRVTIPKKIDSKLSQLFGYFVGDGYIENGDVVELRDERLEVLKAYERIIKDIFCCNSSISKIKDKNCWRLRIFSSTIATFISRLKTDMQLIEKSPNDTVRGFIRGIFDAEGSDSENQVEITMGNEDLIARIHLLLLRFGIHANKNKHGKYYRLCIRGINMNVFKNIGFTAIDKMNRLNKSVYKISRIIPIKWVEVRKNIRRKFNKEIRIGRENSRYVSKNELEKAKLRNGNLFEEIEKLFNINWVKLKKIEVKNELTNLQDMETTHGNYIANGLIVHNSPAAGVHIMSKDWKIFRNRILKLL